MVWADETVEHAKTMLLAKATIKAAGGKNADGSEIELQDPMQVRDDFDAMLLRPLDYEKQRAAVLRLVESA